MFLLLLEWSNDQNGSSDRDTKTNRLPRQAMKTLILHLKEEALRTYFLKKFGNTVKCHRKLTQPVKDRAIRCKLPVSQADFSSRCKDYHPDIFYTELSTKTVDN